MTTPLDATRLLGSTGLRVSEVGFGAARFAETFYDSSDKSLVALLRHSYDAGITFFDTAAMYAQGRSEVLLGKAFDSLPLRVRHVLRPREVVVDDVLRIPVIALQTSADCPHPRHVHRRGRGSIASGEKPP